MKDSRVQWIGHIPEHWHLGRVKNYVLKIGSGITPKGGSDVYVEKGILLYNQLSLGSTLGEAVFEARKACRNKSEDDLSWLFYRVYGNRSMRVKINKY